jgi:hypothetical protein
MPHQSINSIQEQHMSCYDYKVGGNVLVKQDGILRKAECPYSKKPWTITTIFTNGTARIQCGTN